MKTKVEEFTMTSKKAKKNIDPSMTERYNTQ